MHQTIDWPVILVYILLVVFGWINIYAAVYNEEHRSILDFSQRYGKQLLWISISLLLIVIIFILDAKIFEYLAYPVYLFAIGLLIGVLLFGTVKNGAKAWFEFGNILVQPGEFAKITVGLGLARIMSVYDFKFSRTSDLVKVLFLIFLPVGLIILQNDTGSALVYFSFIIVLYREGLSPWYLLVGFLFVILFIISLIADLFVVYASLPFVALIFFHLIYHNLKMTFTGLLVYSLTGIFLLANHYFFQYNRFYVLVLGIVISVVILIYPAYVKRLKFYTVIAFTLLSAMAFTFSVEYIFHQVLEKHQRTRINVVLGLESDPQGVEYNVNQSKIAIGSGEFSGKGFLQGTQTKFDFVPEQDTDFIFCTVGEEWGFMGTFSVLFLFGFLLYRIILIAERQRSKFNRVYGYAVASILFFHIAINIGMTIGLTPVIGIPLPFFSYGGSSLWSFTILLFILVKLDSTRLDKF